MKRRVKVRIYSSIEEENRAEYERRARMSPTQRWEEFAALQVRQWGKKWTTEPMVRKATWEIVKW
jgi:hypothetical protein